MIVYKDEAYELDEFKEYMKENVYDFKYDLECYIYDTYGREIVESFVNGQSYFSDVGEAIDTMDESDIFAYIEDVYELED